MKKIEEIEKGTVFTYEGKKYKKIGNKRFFYSNDPLEHPKYKCKNLENDEEVSFGAKSKVLVN